MKKITIVLALLLSAGIVKAQSQVAEDAAAAARLGTTAADAARAARAADEATKLGATGQTAAPAINILGRTGSMLNQNPDLMQTARAATKGFDSPECRDLHQLVASSLLRDASKAVELGLAEDGCALNFGDVKTRTLALQLEAEGLRYFNTTGKSAAANLTEADKGGVIAAEGTFLNAKIGVDDGISRVEGTCTGHEGQSCGILGAPLCDYAAAHAN